MKEKVILPEGAKHQRVEVAGAVSKAKTKAKRKPIPKPEPLIGGTPVYQKDNGTGYWYCKIKGGRDEFMYLYFGDLTANDVIYDANGKEREFVGERQLEFRENCLKAVINKPKEGFRWIPVYEPSPATDGGVQYVSGEKVLIGLNSYEWEEIFENYSPENESGEASITTYFLLEVRWLIDGLATINQLADDSTEIGHYSNSENAKHYFEKTGEREFGGLCGFVGNTYKEVKDPESPSGFSILGNRYYNPGDMSPSADVERNVRPGTCIKTKVGLCELIGATRHC